MKIIGDIHGDFKWYKKYVDVVNKDQHTTFQIGDFGIGFPHQEEWNKYWLDDPDKLSEMNYVISGNHDNPLYAKNSPLFLPRFGYNEATGIFWVSGAFSIDKYWRTENVNWWNTEELTYAEMMHCQELYEKVKPKVVISHDGPAEPLNYMFPHKLIQEDIPTSSTQNFLQHLYEIHQPEFWFFGHWHQSVNHKDGDTFFQCVGERRIIDFDTSKREIISS